jgi:hypothetical protein
MVPKIGLTGAARWEPRCRLVSLLPTGDQDTPPKRTECRAEQSVGVGRMPGDPECAMVISEHRCQHLPRDQSRPV